jgi:hypothetical protein
MNLKNSLMSGAILIDAKRKKCAEGHSKKLKYFSK